MAKYFVKQFRIAIFFLILVAPFNSLMNQQAQAFPNAGFNNLIGKNRITGSITVSVSAELDDVEIYDTSYWADGEGSNSVNWVGKWYSLPVWGGLRFQLSSAIPSGATITSASISVFGDGREGWDDSNDYLTIIANDSADAPQVASQNDRPDGPNAYYFSAPPGNVTGGSNTEVRWPSVGGLAWNDALLNISPDISPLIQFLVNKHNGLASGASVQLWVHLPIYGFNHEVAYADYGHPTKPAPMLVINWSK